MSGSSFVSYSIYIEAVRRKLRNDRRKLMARCWTNHKAAANRIAVLFTTFANIPRYLYIYEVVKWRRRSGSFVVAARRNFRPLILWFFVAERRGRSLPSRENEKSHASVKYLSRAFYVRAIILSVTPLHTPIISLFRVSGILLSYPFIHPIVPIEYLLDEATTSRFIITCIPLLVVGLYLYVSFSCLLLHIFSNFFFIFVWFILHVCLIYFTCLFYLLYLSCI